MRIARTFKSSLFDTKHPIADPDVRLYVLLSIFSAFQLFA